ncbi:PIG-L family deacetylase [uncultured Flavobacterium sp.]|uniref:PIG-L family deacetylase n=1 Tax=uncultured Flavobacterium sp. TaxID=165435 RepID=UPI0030CA4C6E
MRLQQNIWFLTALFSTCFWAQQPQKLATGNVYEHVKKLNFLGSVLYVAAHPDDENTRLISYFSNHYHAQTAYLSLTRGDGGQNLIGPELREQLGAVRTQELLAARRIDGSKQFFSRANDFGYSKAPTETLRIWNKQEVLDDVIQTIETFQPDIIINRFDHRSPGTTHGHHTASALLSIEAYGLIKEKPKRVFFNTSYWFYGSQEAFDKADKSNLLAINANVFFPILGKSNYEIAALSRSQHRCQGFGSTGTRGDETEYLELLKGTMPASGDIFEGIDTSWNRIKGGNAIGNILNPIEENFNFKSPETHIPQLVKAYKLIQNLEESHWKKIKLEQISILIEACSGLYLEAISSDEKVTKSDTYTLNIEAINRSNANMILNSVSFGNKVVSDKNIVLKNNSKINLKLEKNTIPDDFDYSNLFWLKETPTVGMYKVSNKTIRILPEETLQYPVFFSLTVEGTQIEIIKNVVYKKNDPEFGETYMPFTVLPEVTTNIVNKVSIFKDNQAKEVAVKIISQTDNITGSISLQVDENWIVEPASIAFQIFQKHDEQTVIFKVLPPKKESTTTLQAIVLLNEKKFNQEHIEINYPHIPKQTILQNSTSKLVKLAIETKGKNIGYIQGAGDQVDLNLENLGYKVTTIKPSEIAIENLQNYDAILIGIRAFNVIEELAFKNKILFEYVNNGGNLIVQYNTNGRLVTKDIAPYDLQLSRDRVTNENAKVTFLAPNHPVLNTPNKITNKDFEGWFQEQGLYYPDVYAPEFTAILESNDDGETPKKGALLIAKYGKGNYIYTGLSFFRELPEGVSGAYRLLANIIALE